MPKNHLFDYIRHTFTIFFLLISLSLLAYSILHNAEPVSAQEQCGNIGMISNYGPYVPTVEGSRIGSCRSSPPPGGIDPIEGTVACQACNTQGCECGSNMDSGDVNLGRHDFCAVKYQTVMSWTYRGSTGSSGCSVMKDVDGNWIANALATVTDCLTAGAKCEFYCFN